MLDKISNNYTSMQYVVSSNGTNSVGSVNQRLCKILDEYYLLAGTGVYKISSMSNNKLYGNRIFYTARINADSVGDIKYFNNRYFIVAGCNDVSTAYRSYVGTSLYYSDNGTDWVKANIDTTVYSVYGSTDIYKFGEILVVSSVRSQQSLNNYGGFLYSTDNGVSWKYNSIGTGYRDIQSIYYNEANNTIISLWDMTTKYDILKYQSPSDFINNKYTNISSIFASKIFTSNTLSSATYLKCIGNNILFGASGKTAVSFDNGVSCNKVVSYLLASADSKETYTLFDKYICNSQAGRYPIMFSKMDNAQLDTYLIDAIRTAGNAWYRLFVANNTIFIVDGYGNASYRDVYIFISEDPEFKKIDFIKCPADLKPDITKVYVVGDILVWGKRCCKI